MRQKQAFFTVLNGRVKFNRGDYNVTGDAVFLAASVRIKMQNHDPESEFSVLDAGIGTGGAALCLLARVPCAKVTGIDISETMLDEAAANAKLNDREIELIHGDILNWKTDRTFDVVMTNPPYFKGTPRKGNEKFIHHNVNLNDWVRACLRRVRPHGYFYCITDAATSSEITAALVAGRAGDIEVIPLFSKIGKDKVAERSIVRARTGTNGGTKIWPGLFMDNEKILTKMGAIL
ncbi:MAG: methyltransferase domain-containing protein [Rickettsiales bacterium]|jgi:tRNA1(Val) A37 N6-methylase TrmN6|nr:methyltransferase domain-containing protein [Rickettsiales bacterium]